MKMSAPQNLLQIQQQTKSRYANPRQAEAV